MTGDRRRRRKEARPAEIIEAARAEFVLKGFSAARIEDIAARAGISKGLVYAYFPTKEALFEAVMRSSVLPTIEGVAALIAADTETPAPAQLRMALTMIYAQLVNTDRRRLLHMVIAEAPRFPELARFYHTEIVTRGRAMLRALIERGVARGEFRRSALADYPEIVLAPALVAAMWKLLFEPYEPVDSTAFADAHLEAMLRALSA